MAPSTVHPRFSRSFTIPSTANIESVSFRRQMDLDDGHVNTNRQEAQLEDCSPGANPKNGVAWKQSNTVREVRKQLLLGSTAIHSFPLEWDGIMSLGEWQNANNLSAYFTH